MISPLRIAALCSMALPSAGCVQPQSNLQLDQRSILVLPVVNETTSAEAPEALLSTLGSPLIRRGYYVYPVVPTMELLRFEGLNEGGQLASVPVRSFHDTLGVDAVLYVTLHSWDTNYAVLYSSVTVNMTYELVDARTAEVLWVESGSQTVTSDSSSNSGDPLVNLLSMAVNAAVTAAATEYVPLARQAHAQAFRNLPLGPIGRERQAREQAEQAAVESPEVSSEP